MKINMQNNEKSEIEEVPRVTRRKPMSVPEYIEVMDSLIERMESIITRKKKTKDSGIREMQNLKSVVEDLKKELPRVIKNSKKRRVNPNLPRQNTGLTAPVIISDELAEFLGYSDSSSSRTPPIPREEISRSHINSAICVYVSLKVDETREHIVMWGDCMNKGCKRNLKNPKDGRIIIPDEALSKLLKYDDYVTRVKAGEVTTAKGKVVTDSALRYFNLVSLIQPHISSSKSSPL